ncbi:hypothetical protein AHF37_02684 [Paragonimus kellicotti]|nr:hypothetical protein AHF37_02684 [Paragonimus kellicotti]
MCALCTVVNEVLEDSSPLSSPDPQIESAEPNLVDAEYESAIASESRQEKRAVLKNQGERISRVADLDHGPRIAVDDHLHEDLIDSVDMPETDQDAHVVDLALIDEGREIEEVEVDITEVLVSLILTGGGIS